MILSFLYPYVIISPSLDYIYTLLCIQSLAAQNNLRIFLFLLSLARKHFPFLTGSPPFTLIKSPLPNLTLIYNFPLPSILFQSFRHVYFSPPKAHSIYLLYVFIITDSKFPVYPSCANGRFFYRTVSILLVISIFFVIIILKIHFRSSLCV